jgi:hypothetical protein
MLGALTITLTAVFFPKVAAALRQLPPKLVEIGGAEPAAVEQATPGDGAGAKPRIERTRLLLADPEQTQFSSCSAGDREVVLRLYDTFVREVRS